MVCIKLCAIILFLLLALGETGEVIKVDSDGDLKIKLSGGAWTFNPKCVDIEPERKDNMPAFPSLGVQLSENP
jgi:hypothetical protein